MKKILTVILSGLLLIGCSSDPSAYGIARRMISEKLDATLEPHNAKLEQGDVLKDSTIKYYEDLKEIIKEVDEDDSELEAFFEDYTIFIDEIIDKMSLEESEAAYISYNVAETVNGIIIYKLESPIEIDQELIDRLNTSPHLIEYIAVDKNIVVTGDYDYIYNPEKFLEIVQEHIAQYAKGE